MTDQLTREAFVASNTLSESPALADPTKSTAPRNGHAALRNAQVIASSLRGLVAQHPLTSVLAAAFVVAQSIAVLIDGPVRSVLAWVGSGPGPLIAQGHWWTPFTSLFFADGVPQFTVSLIAVVVLVGLSEKLMGWRRSVVAFVATGVGGILIGIGMQLIGERAGELWAHAVFGMVTVSPFTAACGTIATASAFAGPLWRRRIRLLALLTTLVFALYSGQPSDVYRFAAVMCGIALGMLIGPPMSTRRSGWARSSHHEIRMLMASVIAITAIGPVIALLSNARFGPLSPISLLFTDQTANSTNGIKSFAFEPTHGFGMILLSVMPLVVMLVAAYALAYGSRFALWLAIVVNIILSVSAALSFGLLHAVDSSDRAPFLVERFGEVEAGLVIATLLPLAVAVVLFLLRAHFPVRTSAHLVFRFAITMLIAVVALGIVYVIGTVLTGGAAYLASLSGPQLVADMAQRFVPVHFWNLSHPGSHPTTLAGDIVYHSAGPIFWLVVIVASLRPMLGNGVNAIAPDVARARDLVLAGGDALGFMTTWRGNHYWFDTDGESGIAYRVVNGIAITTGGPFGTPASEEATMRRFARFCDDNGWVPVFYSVDGELCPALLSMGWQTMVVAEEAVISPRNWSTTGKKWQDIRSSINRADRAGIRAEWTSYPSLGRGLQAQLAEISEEWIANKDLPEMGFTLGGIDELRDPAVRLMLATDQNGRVEAVTSWLPRYRDGVVIGWTLDFMRRRAGSINGVMEFLIAAAATRMQQDGIEVMSLSGAPLAHASGSRESAGGLDTLLSYLSASLEPVYGFQSLLRFKRKFQPEFQPLLMAYPDSVALPRIGIALTRAYLPGLSVTQAARLIRSHG